LSPATIRSLDEYPATVRWLMKIGVPRRRALAPDETIAFDFRATRTLAPEEQVFGGLLNPVSEGRLTVTNQRIIYQVGRHPLAIWHQVREDLGDISVGLEAVESVAYRNWDAQLFARGAILPGLCAIQIRLVDGRVLRFADIMKAQWEQAAAELRGQFPKLQARRTDQAE
jgi:hypothetical protein